MARAATVVAPRSERDQRLFGRQTLLVGVLADLIVRRR